MFVGFGAGLTWAASAIKWSVPTEEQEADWWKTTRRQAGYQAAAARSMWRRAVRWVYHVLPTDEENGLLPEPDTTNKPEEEKEPVRAGEN